MVCLLLRNPGDIYYTNDDCSRSEMTLACDWRLVYLVQEFQVKKIGKNFICQTSPIYFYEKHTLRNNACLAQKPPQE